MAPTVYGPADSDYPITVAPNGDTILHTDGDFVVVSGGLERSRITKTGGAIGVFGFGQVRLTAAQVLALKTTPVVLVPSPSAGSMIVPVTVALTYTAGATPFTVDGTTAINIDTIGAVESWFQIGAQSFIDQATNQFRSRMAAATNGASVAYDGVGLQIDVTGTPATLGNGGLVVSVQYIVQPTV